MDTRTLRRAAGLLAFAAGGAVAQSEWLDIQGEGELRALYTNTTIRGQGFVGYYRDDGRGFMVAQNGRTQGRRWSVQDDRQVCVALDGGGRPCFRFQRHKDNPRLIRIVDADKGFVLTATVESGIPDFEPREKANRP